MSDAWDWTTHAFGDLLGTNQAPEKPMYDVNKDAYYDNQGLAGEYSQAHEQLLNASQRGYTGQGWTTLAPAMQVAAQTASAQGGLANTGQFTAGQAAQIGPMNTLSTPDLGPAAQARAAQLGNSDQQFRSGQLGLTNQLQAAAAGQGPSLAASQLGQANAAAAASRMSQAASQRGYGQSAATNRQLAYQQGAANQANAMGAAQLRIQEQQAAQQALGNVLSSSRSQDISKESTQAGLTQQANLANQGATNQFALQGAANQIQVGQGNQAAINQAALQQASYQQAINEANQNAANQYGLSNLQAQNTFGLANMNTANQFALQNMQAQNQVAQQNQQAVNQFALQQGQMTQATNRDNQAAGLQVMGLNDAQVRAMLSQQAGLTIQNQNNQQAYEALKAGQVAGFNNLNTQAYEAAQNNKTQLWSSAIQAVSDEKEKNVFDSIDQKDMDDFSENLSVDSTLAMPDNSVHMKPGGGYLNWKGRLGKASGGKSMGPATKGVTPDAANAALPTIDTSSASSNFNIDPDSEHQSMFAISDKKEKKSKSKSKSKKDIKEFIDTIGAHEYTYKHPNRLGENDKINFGPMAQELEKSKIGQSMVGEAADGVKYVDYARALPTLMAVTSQLNERLKKLESKKGK